MAYLYISYSATDGAPARALRKVLEDEGYHTWMDETRQLGTPELSVLKSAIDSAAAVVVVDFGTDRFAYIVQWEANRAQTSGTPIFVFGKDMEYADVLQRVSAVLSKPDERILLPMPLRWEPPPAPEESRLRRYAWAAMLAGVVGAILWLVLLLHLLTPVPEPAETPGDATPAVLLEASATALTGEPVIATSSPLLFTSTDPTATPSS